MTPEAQNIAIAEACGKEFHRPTAEEIKSGSYYQYEPDYTRDLNAMHGVEKTLGDASFDYDKHLKDAVFSGTRVASFDSYPGDFIWHATAAQRAEAFLKTIGKWTP